MSKKYIYPTRIIDSSKNIANDVCLLKERTYLQIGINESEYAFFASGSFIILDFGKELCGGVRILTYQAQDDCRIRIRFGESVSECCAEIGENSASNDHSPRDIVEQLVSFSDLEFGQSGFRFVRIDVLCGELKIKNVVAASLIAETNRSGYFNCDDDRVNKIFETAAYTLELCQRNGMLWDGIKRDRLVWGGDLHAQMLGTLSLFDAGEHVRRSLRFLREQTPLPDFINDLPVYSLWWIAAVTDYYTYTADEGFLRENADYVKALIGLFSSSIDENGDMIFPNVADPYFFDLDTYRSPDSKAGVYAVAEYVFCKLEGVAEKIGISETVLSEMRRKLRKDIPGGDRAQIIAMQTLGKKQVIEAETEKLKNLTSKDITAFMSYYIFSAMAKSGFCEKAFRIMKEYYGTMLSLGSTTFWEEFRTEWAENSIRLDEVLVKGKKNAHADYGAYCYSGLRKSLCHGWSASPVPFIVKYVLGIRILEPGYKKIRISPDLCGLRWVEGGIPTPYGSMKIFIRREENGLEVRLIAPREISVEPDQNIKGRFIREICEK